MKPNLIYLIIVVISIFFSCNENQKQIETNNKFESDKKKEPDPIVEEIIPLDELKRLLKYNSDDNGPCYEYDKYTTVKVEKNILYLNWKTNCFKIDKLNEDIAVSMGMGRSTAQRNFDALGRVLNILLESKFLEKSEERIEEVRLLSFEPDAVIDKWGDTLSVKNIPEIKMKLKRATIDKIFNKLEEGKSVTLTEVADSFWMRGQ
jgi:hypothetical protein